MATMTVVSSPGGLGVSGDEGNDNVAIDVDADGTHFVLTSPVAFGSATGCTLDGSGTQATCDRSGDTDIEVSMEGGDDVVRIGYGPDNLSPGDFVFAELGPGNDFFGGSANGDDAFGDEGDDVLDGASGDDWLGGGRWGDGGPFGPPAGSDKVFGGPGSDDLQDSDNDSPEADVLDGGGCSSAVHLLSVRQCPRPRPRATST
jgi:hypothetical protein